LFTIVPLVLSLQIEQEVEGIRETHRILESNTMRREGLEKALRVKLEEEIRRLKEEVIKLKGEGSGSFLYKRQE
jgi:hypothetical protein